MERLTSRRITDFFISLSLIFTAIGIIYYPTQIASAVHDALLRCLNVLIPSLFAFIAVSSMLVSCGGIELLSLPLRPVSRFIFRMPDKLFSVMLISMFAGYPVGIRLLSDLLENGDIDERTAERAAVFCYCGGPSFYSGAIGASVFGDRRAGTLIFLSVLIPNIILAVLLCRTSELSCKTSPSQVRNDSILISGVTSAGRSMAAICITVVFFSAMLELLRACGVFELLQRIFALSDNTMTIVSSFIEITALTELKGASFDLLPAVCASCSFGGVCIIIQLFAIKSPKLSLYRFLELRPLAALMSAFVCAILRPHFLTGAVQTMSVGKTLCNVNNLGASICLILMIFLLNLKKSLVISERVCYNNNK
ncbi:MAG: nucleoside recognition protein [Ruminococcus sp.]|nr:nucleoside recognition protein [Ruminococcus sp.]